MDRKRKITISKPTNFFTNSTKKKKNVQQVLVTGPPIKIVKKEKPDPSLCDAKFDHFYWKHIKKEYQPGQCSASTSAMPPQKKVATLTVADITMKKILGKAVGKPKEESKEESSSESEDDSEDSSESESEEEEPLPKFEQTTKVFLGWDNDEKHMEGTKDCMMSGADYHPKGVPIKKKQPQGTPQPPPYREPSFRCDCSFPGAQMQ